LATFAIDIAERGKMVGLIEMVNLAFQLLDLTLLETAFGEAAFDPGRPILANEEVDQCAHRAEKQNDPNPIPLVTTTDAVDDHPNLKREDEDPDDAAEPRYVVKQLVEIAHRTILPLRKIFVSGSVRFKVLRNVKSSSTLSSA